MTAKNVGNFQSDAELFRAAVQGGPKAFEPIVERYQDAVFGISLARLRDFHEAEDMAQHVFVEASRPGFTGQRTIPANKKKHPSLAAVVDAVCYSIGVGCAHPINDRRPRTALCTFD